MPRPRRRLGEIIRAMRTEAGLEQAQLADRVNEITGHEGRARITQPRVSDLERNSDMLERDLANLTAIDQACGHEPGHAAEVAGFWSRVGQVDLEVAIQADEGLDEYDRRTLLVTYRSLRARHEGDVSPSG